MPQITVLPHVEICPAGARFEARSGASICRNLLDQSCACTTCHVIVREGFDSLEPSDDNEDDLLDKAWGLTALSRLSCQAIVAEKDLVIEIPRYTINHAKEG
jgi:2Fe-2S ferredoxin